LVHTSLLLLIGNESNFEKTASLLIDFHISLSISLDISAPAVNM